MRVGKSVLDMISFRSTCRERDGATARLGSLAVAAGTLLALASIDAAQAAPYYDQSGYPGYYYAQPDYYAPRDDAPAPRRPVRRQRQPFHVDREQEKKAVTEAKPQGPLTISVSINEQRLRVYDRNGLFAETPVSTGKTGHATPMGVFSVIQKNKWHRSNLYSDAPMPYMQRITWSGVALHAGALPGYPASHGCIRMPNNFAIRLWNWTRLGARVVIAPGDTSPVDFSHAFLPTKPPAPVTAPAASERTTPAGREKANERIAEVGELRPSAMSATDLTTSGETVSQSRLRTADAGASNTASRLSASDVPSSLPVANNTVKTDSAKADSVKGAAQASTDDTSGKDRARAPDADSPQPPTAGNAVTDSGNTGSPDSTVLPELKRGAPIAVFISRKDGRLYVRQNLKPVFDVPVTIAGDTQLGIHVFTARTDEAEAGSFKWSVVTPPTLTRAAQPAPVTGGKRRNNAAPAPATVTTSTAAEALDRVAVPDDVRTRIAEALSSGSSITVADQGINASGETGQGTDFILRLR